jgi:hypothetical protein
MPNLQQKIVEIEHRSGELLFQKNELVADNRAQVNRFKTLRDEHLALLREHAALQERLARESGRLSSFLGSVGVRSVG